MSEFSCKVMGKHLRDARKRMKLKQSDVAQMTCVSLSYYGKLERGELCPSIGRLLRICKALNVSLSDVFMGTMPYKEAAHIMPPTKAEFVAFFTYLGDRLDDNMRAVMMEVCRQIATLGK